MRKIVLLTLFTFFVSNLNYPSTGIRLTSPSSISEWPLGSTQKISWTYYQLIGNTKIDIYLLRGNEEIGLIKKGIPVSRKYHQWQVGTYSNRYGTGMEKESNLASCYKIQIRILRRNITTSPCFKITKAVRKKPKSILIPRPICAPKIISATPSEVELHELGDPVSVVIRGSCLSPLHSPKVIDTMYPRYPDPEISTKIVSKSNSALTVSLKSPVLRRYINNAVQLRFKSLRGEYIIPGKILKIWVKKTKKQEIEVTGMDPTEGERGSIVQILGKGFTTALYIDVAFPDNTGVINQSGQIINITDTRLQVKVPPFACSGQVEFHYRFANQRISVRPVGHFSVLKRPYIIDFSPKSGRENTVVTIKGNNLSTDGMIKFYNNKRTEGLSLSHRGSTERGPVSVIECRVPVGTETGPIKFLNSHGSATSTGNFEVISSSMTTPPNITGFAPNRGDTNTVVVLQGVFDAIPANNNVSFGTSPTVQPFYASSSGDTLKVRVPERASTGKIFVFTGTGSTGSSQIFYMPPVITDFSPKSGPVGYEITLFSRGFNHENLNEHTVKFNGVEAPVIRFAGRSALVVEIPTGATSGPITVTNPGGSFTTTINFTVRE